MANSEWSTEDAYWRMNYKNRPYASSGNNDYAFYQPGYRYGHDSAHRYAGRAWNEVEADLEKGWKTFEHRSESTWEHIKAAVRDGWDRVTGRHPVGTH